MSDIFWFELKRFYFIKVYLYFLSVACMMAFSARLIMRNVLLLLVLFSSFWARAEGTFLCIPTDEEAYDFEVTGLFTYADERPVVFAQIRFENDVFNQNIISQYLNLSNQFQMVIYREDDLGSDYFLYEELIIKTQKSDSDGLFRGTYKYTHYEETPEVDNEDVDSAEDIGIFRRTGAVTCYVE